jgi:hypothetical protein
MNSFCLKNGILLLLILYSLVVAKSQTEYFTYHSLRGDVAGIQLSLHTTRKGLTG